MTNLTPREIVSELDRFIIGQNDAKRSVAVALRNRWRRNTLVHAFCSERMNRKHKPRPRFDRLGDTGLALKMLAGSDLKMLAVG